MKVVYLGADHRGFKLKDKIALELRAKDWTVTDLSKQYDADDDYPDISIELAQKVVQDKALGVLICGSGAGVTISANKVMGARAAMAMDKKQARKIKEDDNVNILCLSADFVNNEDNMEIVIEFLEAIFMTEERFIRRINKIKAYEVLKVS
jgi:RpiB/LacA/LacB family sugar-phosphate isomerase